MSSEAIDLKPILQRKMIWDIFPCPHQPMVIHKLGLMPGTDDGDEHEHSASHRRLDLLGPSMEAVQLLSAVAGEVVARAIFEDQGIDPDSDHAKSELDSYMRAVVGINMAVVANLLDYGILEIGEGVMA